MLGKQPPIVKCITSPVFHPYIFNSGVCISLLRTGISSEEQGWNPARRLAEIFLALKSLFYVWCILLLCEFLELHFCYIYFTRTFGRISSNHSSLMTRSMSKLLRSSRLTRFFNDCVIIALYRSFVCISNSLVHCALVLRSLNPVFGKLFVFFE